MKKIFSLSLSIEIYNYLKLKAKENYCSMAAYITQLLISDMKNGEDS